MDTSKHSRAEILPFKLIILVLLIQLLSATGASASEDNNMFTSSSTTVDYEAVFEPIIEINLRQDARLALSQGRHVMVMFIKDGCSPCEQMKREVLTDPEVQVYFKKNFLSYHVNIYGDLPFINAAGVALTEKTYAAREGIWGTPAFHFFGKDGRLVHKHIGGLSKEAFIRMGQKVAALQNSPTSRPAADTAQITHTP